MCTAITYLGKDHYFGRNLDYEYSFEEKVIITSRNFPFSFRHTKDIPDHYAIIGMGIVSNSFPLYFDATNEKGLSMAGLLFPHFSYYHTQKSDKENVASFELIPYVLSQCESVADAKKLLENVNVTDEHFSDEFPPSPLHWMIADKSGSIAVESVKEGLMIYDNLAGVLTNSPSFPLQMFNLSNYMGISPSPLENNFSSKLPLSEYSRGMGAIGLPGDLSSASRFVRASFTRLNSCQGESEQECVNQFFHILGSVYQTRGCVSTKDGHLEATQYSACVNTDKGIYYYTTYDNSSLNAVNLNSQDLNAQRLYTFSLEKDWRVNFQS